MPSLRTKRVDFTKLWNAIRSAVLALLNDPHNAKIHENLQTLHLFVYRICTSACYNIPSLEELPIFDENDDIFDDNNNHYNNNNNNNNNTRKSLQEITTPNNHKNTVREGEPQPHVLYALFRNLLQRQLAEHFLPECTGMGEDLLSKYQRLWDQYALSIEIINSFFYFMNKDWISSQRIETWNRVHSFLPKNIYSIKSLGTILWRDTIFHRLESTVLECVFSLIDADRNGSPVQTSILSSTIQSFITMNSVERDPLRFYHTTFETQLLKRTAAYYRAEADALLARETLQAYVQAMLRRVEQERNRARSYLHYSSEKKIIRVCVRETVVAKLDALLSDLDHWLRDDKKEDLQRLHELLAIEKKTLVPLVKAFENQVGIYGKQKLSEINLSSKEQQFNHIYVETICQLYDKFNTMVQDIFHNDEYFAKAKDSGIRVFINENDAIDDQPAKTSELLARYAHTILRPRSKIARGLSEQDLEQRLLLLVHLSSLLREQDVFREFYSSLLSRRLIFDTYTPDLEALVISKLKEVSSMSEVYKMQRMFTDMDVSRELSDSFRDTQQGTKIDGNFSVLILTKGFWPLVAPPTPFRLPAILEQQFSAFESFYLERFQGRKLTMLPHFSMGFLKTNFTRQRQYELQLSTYQMGVLLPFNDALEYSVADLSNITDLLENELHGTISSLVQGNILEIVEGSSQEPLNSNTRIKLNLDYKHKHRKVALHQMTPSTRQQQTEKTLRNVDENRKMAIQAAIVRVMKARKEMEHTQLMTEVIRLLEGKCHVDVTSIKRNIGLLIEREFLERHPSQPNAFRYLA